MWLRGLNDLGWQECGLLDKHVENESTRTRDHSKEKDDDAEEHWRLDAGGEQETQKLS